MQETRGGSITGPEHMSATCLIMAGESIVRCLKLCCVEKVRANFSQRQPSFSSNFPFATTAFASEDCSSANRRLRRHHLACVCDQQSFQRHLRKCWHQTSVTGSWYSLPTPAPLSPWWQSEVTLLFKIYFPSISFSAGHTLMWICVWDVRRWSAVQRQYRRDCCSLRKHAAVSHLLK